MARFVRNIVFFLLPFVILLVSSVPFYFMAKETGEFNPIEESIEKQRNNYKCLIGLGYNEQTPYYKLLNANYYKAPIISLGTSRVMQFKEGFFSSQFYNCGGGVRYNYDEYLNFLKNLQYTPEIIILGLDSWVFNEEWNLGCEEYNTFHEIQVLNRDTISIMKAVIKDWILRKWTVSELRLYPENIGFNGRVKDSGFMYDGSYYYGDFYRNPSSSKDYQFVDTRRRIKYGLDRFEYGKHIYKDTLSKLEDLLSYCKEKNIIVIGFLPPFAPSIYEIMNESGNYNYLTEISSVCNDIFRKYEYELYDFMDVENLGMTDNNFIDGFHGSDIVYGKILQKMVWNNSVVKDYVDLNNIQYLINNAFSEYVFENPFIRNSKKQ